MYQDTIEMAKEYQTIILAALLHDIGKFMQRAEVELCFQSKEMETALCPFHEREGYFSHQYVLWTDHFFREVIDESLLSEILGPSVYPDNVANLASCHRKPSSDSKLQKLIQQADIASASEEAEVKGREQYKRRRLSSVFEKVTLQRVPPAKTRFRYKLNPLSLDKNSFPAIELKEEESLVPEYKELWEMFYKELKEIESQVRQSGNKFDLLFNSLYCLLQKYTWCIPSYTQSECDISLFDHLRTTSAIASCLYNVQTSAQPPEDEFLLVEGDISGIQRFIYRLSQPTGVSHIAKMFRGRSFYLTLLPWVLANHIVSKLNLTIANILWCGGGKFNLLLPNTEEVKARLEGIESQLSEWFFRDFEAELGIALGEIEANREDLKDFGTLLDELSIKVEEEKRRKFIHRITTDIEAPIWAKTSPQNLCRVCNLYAASEGKKICEQCEFQQEIGYRLPNTDYLILARGEAAEVKNSFSIPFGAFGVVYLLNKEGDARPFLESEKVTHIFAINYPDFPLGFTLIGKEVATANRDLDEETGEGDILPFEYLANMSEGDKRLGVVKIDIDHLGLIFALGLEEDRSISRIATMSRELDWFFSGYIKTIAHQVFMRWINKEISVDKSIANGCIYTVYSGGDDLLVVAPWSEAIEFAGKVRKEFKQFTCCNSDIDLSAGVFLCKPKFPISRASLLATEAIDEAKGKGRKRISLFGDIATWEGEDGSPGFDQLLYLDNLFTEALNRNQLPRRFLHRLLELRKLYGGDKPDLNYIPALVYLIIRTISNEELKSKLWKYFISGNDAQGYFKNCLIPASIALLKTRKGG